MKRSIYEIRKTKGDLLKSLNAAYPLSSVKSLSDNEIIPYGQRYTYRIDKANEGIRYYLVNEMDDLTLDSKVGMDETLELHTPLLKKLVNKFKVLSEDRNNKDKREVIKKFIVNTELNTRATLYVNKATVPYGEKATLTIKGTQESAIYQLFDDEGLVLSPKYRADNSEKLKMSTYALYENTHLNVKMDYLENNESNYIIQRPMIRVQPRLDMDISADKTLLQKGDRLTIKIENTQDIASYQVYYEFIEGVKLDVPRISHACSEMVQGNNKTIEIHCYPEFNARLAIIVMKEGFKEEIIHERININLCPPNTAYVRVISDWIPVNHIAVIGVSPVISGLKYQLFNENSQEVVAEINYLDPKGVGEGEIEKDFIIYQEMDDEIELKSQPLSQNTNFHVVAINPKTQARSIMKQRVRVLVGKSENVSSIPLREGIAKYVKR